MDTSEDSTKKPEEQPLDKDEAPPSDRFRPRIKVGQGNKFQVNDSVYFSDNGRRLQGPYLIARVLGAKQYTLSEENGTSVEGGKVFEESSLEFAE